MTAVTTACLALAYLGLDALLARRKHLPETINFMETTMKGDSHHEN